MRKILKRLYYYTEDSRSDIRKGILFSFLNKVFDIAPEILIGVAVDLVVRRQHSLIASFGITDPRMQLVVLGVITFIIWSCESLFQYLYSIKWKQVAQNLQHALRLDTYAHLQRLDLEWLAKNRTGNIQTIINDDVNQLERFIDSGFNEIIQIVSSTIIIGIVFFFISPLLALGTVLPIPVIFLGVFWFRKKIQPRYAAVREHAGQLGARIQSNISGIEVIKSYGAEAYQTEAVSQDSQRYRVANEAAIRVSSAFIPVVRIVILAGFLLTLTWGGWMTFQNELPVGSYSALVFLTQRFLWPFTTLGQIIDNFSRAQASTERIFDLLDTPVGIADKVDPSSGPKQLTVSSGHIKFVHVNFSYDKNDRTLHDIDMTIQPKSTVGLVGPSGSGKSSIVRLLLRFYVPSKGQILLDHVPITDLSLAHLRAQIAYISQDAILFPGTVAENIAFGHKAIDHDRLIDAAEKAQIHDYVTNKLQSQYETILGERGQNLSGGQRQRIAIARAIYREAPIVIFDEATSAIDNRTEIMIRQALSDWLKTRTSILIAHRLSTVVDADQIYVVNDGKIVEQGTHKSLLTEQNSIYGHLWSLQTTEPHSD